jgi:hypothetical protein
MATLFSKRFGLIDFNDLKKHSTFNIQHRTSNERPRL